METAVESEVVYHILPPEEWERLKPMFEAHGAAMPAPEVASAAVAERDGKIVGFLILQFALHAEPLWIDPAERGKVAWKRLLSEIEQRIPKGVVYYSFAPDGHVKKFCEFAGMTELPWTPYMKEIK